MLDAHAIVARVADLKKRQSEHQQMMKTIRSVRRGEFESVMPGLFPESWPKPLVANFIDVAAGDFAGILSPLPSVDCSSATMASDAARKFAEKRTRIVRGQMVHSDIDRQMNQFANHYTSYANAYFVVRPDFNEKTPRFHVIDPVGTYPQLDRQGKVIALGQTFKRKVYELCAEYEDQPVVYMQLRQLMTYGDDKQTECELIQWYDKEQITLLTGNGIVLSVVKNPISRCWVVGALRPGLDWEHPRGQFDDVVAIQMARAKAALYAMDTMEQSVHAPIIVPDDIQEMPFGPDALLRTSNPQGVSRLALTIPQGTFAELQNLDSEMRTGSRYPEGRTGNVNASIITGEGVQALMGTFNSQIASDQLVFSQCLREVFSIGLEMDERLWPDDVKTVRGLDKGAPFELTYKPSKDIKGDWTVYVTYGMAAGLDPNRALVFFLQAQGAGLVSKKRIRESLPMDINLAEEEMAIDVEVMRTSLAQALAAYGMAIPQMASAGQDPNGAIRSIAIAIQRRQKGDMIEDAVTAAFKPAAPPPGQQAPQSPMEAMQAAMQGGGGGGGGGPQGDVPTDLTPGHEQLGAGGARDLLMSMAGTSRNGNPNLGMVVSRRQPAI